MTEITRVTAPSVGALDQLLLDTKLAIPLPRAGFVSRADLISRGSQSDRRVVAITAPSGYGKSTLLSQWAAAEDRPVAWVSLDRFDDDPAALLFLLASAFARATNADPSLISDMRGPGGALLGRAAPRLASAFRTSPRPFVIMLDDLHELDSPSCHDVLSVVLGGIPLGSQFIAASRVEQPHVPRLRSSGDTIEFGVDDLALDATGAQRIFAEESVELDAVHADAVADRTEGWPVGLHLAAIIARDTDDLTTAVSGDDRFVADYLYRESLTGLPDEIQQFLRRTSVLDQFSAELCDAILHESGAQARLRDLERLNVFLVPLDRHRDWYRYHSLFREFLAGELRRTEPDLIGDLHSRAADWYEVNGSPAKAIEHLLETSDVVACVRLVTELALPTYQAGQMETVHRWITALGDDAVAAYPPLAVLTGWIAVISGHAAEADRWAQVIDRASFDGVPADGTASFASARAMLRSMMCTDGPDQAAADAAFGLSQESLASAWRDQAVCLVAEAHLLIGEVDEAEARFAEATALAIPAGNIDVQVLSDTERALILMDHGRWVEASGLVDGAMTAIDEHRLNDYAISVLTFSSAARLALHRGDLPRAAQELTRAMRARQYCTYAAPALAVRARLSLARTYVAVGDEATAHHLMREIDEVLMRRPRLGTLTDEVAAFRTIIDTDARGPAGASPLTPAELRLLPYLQTHLTIPEIGARLFVSRNTVSTEVGSIYRKLGVSSRSDAVNRATAIGLLGE
ncbi:LuxR C-terminal-related transcriptional regulator [Leifsonia sp. NPDC058230]|uniref:LuxR C-terminal-related transcriptional regulator n=1 Tax=Leifsonia sp. NPDC058230 TaxID=3346391 RepID=UPI0036DD5ECF